MLRVKCQVKESLIQGVGCFTMEDIPAGKVVWKFDQGIDKLIRAGALSQSDAYRDFVQRYGYQSMQDRDLWILPIDHARFMNHSENPNLASLSDASDVAMVDIKAGTELTCDYWTFDASVGDRGFGRLSQPGDEALMGYFRSVPNSSKRSNFSHFEIQTTVEYVDAHGERYTEPLHPGDMLDESSPDYMGNGIQYSVYGRFRAWEGQPDAHRGVDWIADFSSLQEAERLVENLVGEGVDDPYE